MGIPRRDGPANALRLVPRDGQEPEGQARATLDDAALVAAVRSGDAAVASRFCDRVWPPVDRTIRRLLGHRDVDRDDVAQLALIELVGTIGRYRGDCTLDSWAQTITSRVIFKHIRRRRLERQLFTELLSDEIASYAAPVQNERRAATRELLTRVGQLLDELNAERAWAFVLHDLLGYDLREIAQMTGASVAAAQSRLVRGRRELHERVAGDPALVELVTEMERGP
jgi:RNA polymerase sigma-70 factor (ECF subfamily)